MLDLPRLERIAKGVVDAVSIPVTAKIRTGFSQQNRNAPQAAKRLEQAGVQAICVHARTRDQVHSGPVDLEILAEICTDTGIPVIGNGNIGSKADAEEMIARTGCDQVAIGQAAKGNPWVFPQVLGDNISPDLAARIRLCRRHLELYLEWTHDERRSVMEMRKHACWYLKGFSGAARFRHQLAHANDIESFYRLLESADSNEDGEPETGPDGTPTGPGAL
jgi:tRNA-dihydrouridine synthase